MHELGMRISASAVTLPSVTNLVMLADTTRTPATDWVSGLEWTAARNAHRTNTPAELQHALQSDVNWMEGDVRMAPDGQLVMAHDRGDIGRGMTLDAWLMVGARSGRGVKVELKESVGFDQMLAALARTPIPQERLIVNVNVVGAAAVTLTDEQLRRLRRMLPDATLNLSADPTDALALTRPIVQQLTRAATIVGGKVMFPLQWDLVTDEVIAALTPFGRIATWSAWWWGTPANVDEETQRLRQRGVDGMIDLPMNVAKSARLVSLALRGLGNVFGRQAVVDAREAIMKLRHPDRAGQRV
jgi:hypothetical protein